MSEENNQQGKKKKRLYDEKQYKRLLDCSKRGEEGIGDWNYWRWENRDKEILLEGADLVGAPLEGVNLDFAHLEGADLECAHLEGAELNQAHLKGAYFFGANLERAFLYRAHLEGANFNVATLKSAVFNVSLVNSTTSFLRCDIDRETDFRDVNLDTICIEKSTKQLLEYNIRRMNWQDWYKGKSEKKWIITTRQVITSPICLFWSMSDYGRSTGRIILAFFALAFVFAVAYQRWPDFVVFDGCVKDFQSLLHAFYFSVVTMTTLGFGDIAANPHSWQGQVLLMLQVILGYVLLAALVTRFAVLFTAGGPAGKFSKRFKKLTEEPPEKPIKKPTKNPPK